MTGSTPLAVVLMPPGEAFDRIREGLVVPALLDAGFAIAPSAPYHLASTLERAGLVVADLTDRNPDVLFELGVAHGLGRPTLLLAQHRPGAVDDLPPLDLRGARMLLYSTRFDRAVVVRQQLAAAAIGALEDRLPSRDADADAAAERLLRALVDFAGAVTEIGAAVAGLGEDMRHGSERLAEVVAGGADGVDAAERLARTMASDLSRFATELDERVPAAAAVADVFADVGPEALASAMTREPSDASAERRKLTTDTHAGVQAARAALGAVGVAIAGLPPAVPEIVDEQRAAAEALQTLDAALGRVAAYLEQALALAELG